jgi:threonine/homoserine/homoserine lactone efflux protein
VIDWLIIVLFVFLMVRTYLRRRDTSAPKWMGRLQSADPRFSFRLGLLLFLVMPTDVITMFTVGASLTRNGQPWWHSLPFVGVTLLLVGLPLIDLLLLGKRAEVLLPKVRDWMTSNSWVISELVIVSSSPSPSPASSAKGRRRAAADVGPACTTHAWRGG